MNNIQLKIPYWPIEEMTGYTPKTTFWQDFSIADCFGSDAVQDTFNRVFEDWRMDYIYLTELVLVLNHKIWQHYESNEPLARLYNRLWELADAYASDNLKDDELLYFYQTTD